MARRQQGRQFTSAAQRVATHRAGTGLLACRCPDPGPGHTFATQGEAARWLTLVEAEIVRGDWIDPYVGTVPLLEYAEQWITERAKDYSSTGTSSPLCTSKTKPPTWKPGGSSGHDSMLSMSWRNVAS